MNGQSWSSYDRRRLAALYPCLPTTQVAKTLNRNISAVYGMANKLGIAKTSEYLQRECRLQKGHKIGRSTQFKKGSVPANKGLRRPGWHVGRMKETQFKKGNRSGKAAENWVPIGTILPDPDGYLRIKVREAVHGEATGYGNTQVWPMYNRYLWEQHKGPIPPKHMVVFKDRNRANCVIDNLELISMKENARRNHWSHLPRELAEVIHLNGALKRQIRRLNGKEQGK